MKVILLCLLGISGFIETGAQTVKGRVNGTMDGKALPLGFANVYWAGTTIGTVSDSTGHFELEYQKGKDLVVSFVGFVNDTLWQPDPHHPLAITLDASAEIEEVRVVKYQGGSYISALNPIKTETITSEGLQRLACCNLSESFENNATVDVGFTDAITGAKQIQMLGLSGTYSQLLSQNLPAVRGLSAPYGLSYIPGSWMESIQVSKGTSSVINGFESITGQINVEYKKPETVDPFFLNIYGNSEGRMETNVVTKFDAGNRAHSALYVHGSNLSFEHDINGDKFLDIPMGTQINLMNQWEYHPSPTSEGQTLLQVLTDRRRGGQVGYHSTESPTAGLYGSESNSELYRFFTKNGIAIPGRPQGSVGLQLSGSIYHQQSFYGLRNYSGDQKSAYANLIYQDIVVSTNHKINAGVSYQFDEYNEHIVDPQHQLDTLPTHTESVPGMFAQYTYAFLDKIQVIGGLRTDYHSRYGWVLIPRLHTKYSAGKHTTLRGSIGRGVRSPSPMADYSGILVNNRQLVFVAPPTLEDAWTYGVSVTHDFHLGQNKEITFTADYYRTEFTNQYLADFETPGYIRLYNLQGKSYSNNYQADVTANIIRGLEITAAFRYSDVQVDYLAGSRPKPLSPEYKGLLTFSYATKYQKWKIDITNQFVGPSRIPATIAGPDGYSSPLSSEAYYILHTQLTRKFRTIEIYIGGENLTNFMQDNPVLAADQPFSPQFDASLIWGPLMGRSFYAGLRWKIGG